VGQGEFFEERILVGHAKLLIPFGFGKNFIYMELMKDVPRSEQFDDVYFSADDGPGETQHVFLDGNNLPARWQGADRFTIGETGFGTGLNFLLAWELFDRTAKEGAFLDFVSVEKFPLSVEEIRKGLSPWADRLSPYLDKMLAQYPIRVPGFHRMVFDGRVALTLIFDDANEALEEIEGSIDAWFLDGFTPAKNPDMWTDKVFSAMARLSHNDTTFATFTSAGFVKRGLQAAGFTVEKKNGFGRKRDMLAGGYQSGAQKTPHKCPNKISILGAGLAGCAAAYVLKQYGFNPTLSDPNGIASGASGNPRGIINPRFTAFRTPESDFYTAAFAQTVRSFSALGDIGYAQCGSLHLVTDEEKEKRFSRTLENWAWHADHMQSLSASEASKVAGVTLDKPALFLPDSGQVNPALLCKAYSKDINIAPTSPECDIMIYANGPAFVSDPTFSWLKLQTVRGQITTAKATAASRALKTNLCYGGYISPSMGGEHIIGSTFQKWMADTNPVAEDDASNLAKLAEAVPDMTGFEVAWHRAALRVSANDRFPVIGQISDREFITTAHGSHGIAGTLMAAHLLADHLRGGPFSIGKSTLKALSPERFKERELRKSARIS